MKFKLIIIFFLQIISNNIIACECECLGDCSFHKTVKNSSFVALVRVISYDDYLDNDADDIIGHADRMPHSMTVEVIKKYRGTETRARIKIWGDNGALCRPYISNFKIGSYFLIAPSFIKKPNKSSNKESSTDYEFFSCSTDYLIVDMKKNIAYGKYSKQLNQIALDEFEKSIK